MAVVTKKKIAVDLSFGSITHAKKNGHFKFKWAAHAHCPYHPVLKVNPVIFVHDMLSFLRVGRFI